MAATQTSNAKRPKKKIASEILREKKLLAFRDRIARAERTITEAEKCRSALAMTDCIGASVVHKTFGTGIIVEQLPSSITVKFDLGSKRFLMPSAFVEGFLTAEAPELNDRFIQYQGLGTKIRLAKEDMSFAARSIRLLEKR